MPRYRRLVVPHHPHHVTQRGVRRQTTFFNDLDYRRYLRLAAELLQDVNLEIWAYCLMPNHMHAIVVPRCNESLSKFFAQLHRRYARGTNRRNEWRGHLWQERFYSVVMDESHTLCAMRYVERNPVRAGLCQRAQDWPWSSARGNLNLTPDPLIDRRRTQPLIANWREYLQRPESSAELKDLREQTATGRPKGNVWFIRSLESATGRSILPRKPGPKR